MNDSEQANQPLSTTGGIVPVYVDHERIKFRGFVMGHMVADTLVELHEMASRIGLRESWFQASQLGIPHYDVAESIRKRAIALGAQPIDRREMVDFIQRFKTENHIR